MTFTPRQVGGPKLLVNNASYQGREMSSGKLLALIFKSLVVGANAYVTR